MNINIVSFHLVIQCLSQMNKVDYYSMYQTQLQSIIDSGKRPSLLLHTCCGVCGGSVFEQMIQHFDVTLYFYNPNIHPEAEYIRRRDELMTMLDRFNLDHQSNIKFIEGGYDPAAMIQKLQPFKDEREGQNRCGICYAWRIEATYDLATKLHFDYCTTVLTVSRHKDSQKLNRIAIALQPRFKSTYLISDFKKKDGTKRSQEIATYYDLYKQCYCGCVFSKINQNKKGA